MTRLHASLAVLFIAVLAGVAPVLAGVTPLGGAMPGEGTDVTHVNLIFMTHLDAGFQLQGKNMDTMPVFSHYMNEYLPIAMDTAAAQRGTKEQFRWTLHPYVLSLLLHCPAHLPGLQCPSEELRSRVAAAVRRRDLQFHAGPMNLQAEMADADLFDYGLTIAQDVAREFGVAAPSVLSHRDVPGLTRSVIPLLRARNVTGISVGTNDGTVDEDVPNMFVWKDEASGLDALVAYHQGGYPDEAGRNASAPGGLARKHCHILPTGRAQCFAFRMDNGPPPSPAEVKDYYRVLRSEFPGADITAGSFEDFFTEMDAARHGLPVVTHEIGDSWIMGAAADPVKQALFRIMARERLAFLQEDPARRSDVEVREFSRMLLKITEHTDGVSDLKDDVHWDNESFRQRRDDTNYIVAEHSWQEQRDFLWWAVGALSVGHPLRARVEAAIKKWTPAAPDLEGYEKLEVGDEISCSRAGLHSMRIATDGSVSSLVTTDGTEWAGQGHPLSQLQYSTHTYVVGGSVNMTSGHPEDKVFYGEVRSLHFSPVDCAVKALLATPAEAHTKYGAPPEVWMEYTARAAGRALAVDVSMQWLFKEPTRMPETVLLIFEPRKVPGRVWMMDKMSSPVSIVDSVNRGPVQHLVQEGVSYMGRSASGHQRGFALNTVDCGLVTPHPYPLAERCIPVPRSQPQGFAVYAYTNIWQCNYPFYFPFGRADDTGAVRIRQTMMFV